MSKQKNKPTPFAIFPTGPAIDNKLALLEQQTGLDPALIIRCLILGADVKLVRVCAAGIGLKVPVVELELVVSDSSEHLHDADHYLAGGVTEPEVVAA